MDDHLQQFLAEAKSVRLNADEKEKILIHIQNHQKRNPVRNAEEQRQIVSMEDVESTLAASAESSLQSHERDRMRKKLLQHMKRHPARDSAMSERQSALAWITLFMRGVLPRTLVLTCAFLLIGSSAAVAAEDALPGDWLYPLKVDVSEQLRSKLLFSNVAKARWQGERAIRRLEEAAVLAAGNALTKEIWAQLHDEFLEHVQETQRYIDAVAVDGHTEDAVILSNDLQDHLAAHTSVIDVLGQEHGQNSSLQEVLERVKTTQDTVRERSSKRLPPAANHVSSIPDRQKVHAQQKIRDAAASLEELRNDVRDGSVARQTIRQADSLLQKAQLQFRVEQYENATDLARQTARLLEEAKILNKLHTIPAVDPEAAYSSISSDAAQYASSSSTAEHEESPEEDDQAVITIPIPEFQMESNNMIQEVLGR